MSKSNLPLIFEITFTQMKFQLSNCYVQHCLHLSLPPSMSFTPSFNTWKTEKRSWKDETAEKVHLVPSSEQLAVQVAATAKWRSASEKWTQKSRVPPLRERRVPSKSGFALWTTVRPNSPNIKRTSHVTREKACFVPSELEFDSFARALESPYSN